MGEEHCTVLPLRWCGLDDFNVVGSFTSLERASQAARALNLQPAIISAIVVAPEDPTAALRVMLGVHTAEQLEAATAAESLRRSGAASVTSFSNESRRLASIVGGFTGTAVRVQHIHA
jgi:hypothetical protein